MNRRLVACVLAVCVLVTASSAPLAGSVAATVPLLPGEDSATTAPFGQVSRTGGHIVSTERVHERGITGDGVAVGVVGASFEPEGTSLDGQVAGHRRAPDERGTGEVPVGPQRRADGRHDTAVAAVVAETAPDAKLYLAAVGDDPTPEEYERAIDWLVANDVTVVVDAGSYFASNPETNERITAAAERAAANGTTFVTSAGNYANSQWVGDGPADGWVNFSNETQGNRLAGGAVTGGEVSLRLSWNTSADYDLYLYRERANGPDPVVAKSVRRQNDSAEAWEAVDASVPRGRYYVAVDAYDANRTTTVDDANEGANLSVDRRSNASANRSRNASATRLRLLSSRHSLEHAVSNESVVAPATGEGVVAVGAVDTDSGRIAPYSSRSDSLVDVWGPATVRTESGTLEGTSAAAPYVAGTAALVASTCTRERRPGELVELLRNSATDDRYTPDSFAVVEATRAVEAAERPGPDGRSFQCHDTE
ncbi:S8 family serine peptidase [Haloprofundus halophilus]|uniref:S8 family serine peptidase n=1 Tax=Haloprofundus halophilus TaxID=2283527 RepID=UPI000E4400E6|nr:S8 family serine peptidase [Haloprofundus halophilus]